MSVSVVQLTHDNRDQVRRFLPTVAALVGRREVREWIVLDNGSSDGTAEDLRALARNCPKLRVIWARANLGCGGGRNVAWREARGELVLSLDSDVEVTRPEALAEMVRDLARPGVGIVGEHGGWIRSDWGWTVEAPRGYVGRLPIVCGFCQLFRREFLTDWVQRAEYGPYWLDDSEFSLQVQERHGLQGWIGRYGLLHAWSRTNGRDNSARRAAWVAFRDRWRRSGLEVGDPTLPARPGARSGGADPPDPAGRPG